MIVARPYQEDCIDKTWSSLRVDSDILNVLPTASGKTIIFTLLLKKALDSMRSKDRNLKAMILVNQVKLVTQTRDKLIGAIDEENIGLYCGSLGDYDSGSEITVASINTVEKITPFLHLLIIDEAHNAENSATYQNFIKRLRTANPNLKIVRFTATPYTAQSGYIFGKDKEIKRITYRKTLQEMIGAGFIVEPIFQSTKEGFDTSKIRKRRGEFILKDLEKISKDQEKIRLQVADALPRLSGRKKVVWSCTCIEHAELVQKEISIYEAATTIHSKLKSGEQRLNIQEFEEGSVRHITSVTMVSEGYDFEAIDAIVCMRPTRSPVLYVQLCGRGLRLFPGKKNCLFLDYGEVVENLGHPNNPVVNDPNKKSNKAEKKAIICPACEHFVFLPAKDCRQCGYEFFKEERDPVDRTKKLTTTAGEHKFTNKLKKEDVVELMQWSIDDKYVSRAGNECIKITYMTLLNTYTEYIKKGTFVHKRFLEEQATYNRCPVKIKIERDGKWTNVTRRFY